MRWNLDLAECVFGALAEVILTVHYFNGPAYSYLIRLLVIPTETATLFLFLTSKLNVVLFKITFWWS